jgi:hypothetical protein
MTHRYNIRYFTLKLSKGQEFLTLEDGTDTFSRNVGYNYHYSLRNSPDEGSSHPLRRQSRYHNGRVCTNNEGCNADSPRTPENKVPVTLRNYAHNNVSPYQWNTSYKKPN